MEIPFLKDPAKSIFTDDIVIHTRPGEKLTFLTMLPNADLERVVKALYPQLRTALEESRMTAECSG